MDSTLRLMLNIDAPNHRDKSKQSFTLHADIFGCKCATSQSIKRWSGKHSIAATRPTIAFDGFYFKQYSVIPEICSFAQISACREVKGMHSVCTNRSLTTPLCMFQRLYCESGHCSFCPCKIQCELTLHRIRSVFVLFLYLADKGRGWNSKRCCSVAVRGRKCQILPQFTCSLVSDISASPSVLFPTNASLSLSFTS